jgi:DNA-binding CsgD family transcriptional regulator
VFAIASTGSDTLPRFRECVASARASLIPASRHLHQLLVLVALGYSDREIGEQLGLSPKTVQMHRQRAQILLRLSTFEEIVRWARQEGILPASRFCDDAEQQ